MIHGIGIDLVQIQRIKIIYHKYGSRFINHILTEREKEVFFQIKHNHENYLSKRFATKEAFVKALGLGFRKGITLTSIGTHHDELNKPSLHFNHHVQEILSLEDIQKIHISVSDDKNYAISTVILEK